MWTDINVMVFVGFGFLKAFLRTHSWTAVTFNLLVGALACQWAIICYGFWEKVLVSEDNDWTSKIQIDVQHLIIGSQGAAAAMISSNALIGKISYV